MSKFEKLSRAEMKNVTGGNMPVGRATCTWYGSCEDWGDDVFYDPNNAVVATTQQSISDSICMAMGPCCTDVDCPGAVS